MISVLVPVHSVPVSWFEEAMGSVVREMEAFAAVHGPGMPAVELVLVSDGVTQEDLVQALDRRATHAQTRVIRSYKNLGVAGALNLGLQACRYEFVARFDADDVMLPGRLEAQWRFLTAASEVDCLSTGLNYYVRTGDVWSVTDEILHPEVVTVEVARKRNWFMNHPTVMYRRSRVLEVGGYDASLKGLSEDLDLWARMLRRGMSLRNLQRSFHLLRLSPHSATAGFGARNRWFLRWTRARLWLPAWPARLRKGPPKGA